MRLLNCSTFLLKEFKNPPPYAILSHCWEENREVTFDDFNTSQAMHMPGFRKIARCCQTATEFGLEYVWIDTCCIDKKSSAELSEAINSMHKWYGLAKICFAYLADYDGDHTGTRDPSSSFSKSRWFTRGWTLQELMAPLEVVFYNSNWIEVGARSTLRREISLITGINMSALMGSIPDEFSIAQKMSWAAKRETTRPEDLAYCLLGLFDINMPIIYGEGTKAFERLQLEIIKSSDDQSLFAWKSQITYFLNPLEMNVGVLASSPGDFAQCATFKRVKGTASSFTMTNCGLSIELPLIPIPQSEMRNELSGRYLILPSSSTFFYKAVLNCGRAESSDMLAIYLLIDSARLGHLKKTSCIGLAFFYRHLLWWEGASTHELRNYAIHNPYPPSYLIS